MPNKLASNSCQAPWPHKPRISLNKDSRNKASHQAWPLRAWPLKAQHRPWAIFSK